MKTLDWRSLSGYGDVLRRWQKMLNSGFCPSVLLLSGREGTGKSLLMRAMIAFALCEKKIGCGSCVECQRVLLGEHSEMLWLDSGEEPLKVADAEKMRGHFAYYSSRRRKRAVGIVDIDLMTHQGVNGLLKTLEEPPEDALIVMTTSRLISLLPTLRSRATTWHLHPPQWVDVRHLVLEKAMKHVEERVLEGYFHQTGYSVGSTLKLVHQEDDALKRDVVDFLEAETLKQAWEVLQRSNIGKQRTFDLIRRIEYDMNALYRSEGDRKRVQTSLVKRRRLLQDYKKHMSGRHHSLNTQLFAEGVVLSPLQYRGN
ncbi:MAG: hypothetical protein AB8C84_01145 [Oligoflexales bacterium]